MHLLKYGLNKRALSALHNRQEISKAGLTRRDLLKLGILTSAGCLVEGFTSRGAIAASPSTRAFVELLPTVRDRGPSQSDQRRRQSRLCSVRRHDPIDAP